MRRPISQMELFRKSVGGADGFPTNLVLSNGYAYQRSDYVKLQTKFENDLYCEQDRTAVDVFDIRDNVPGCRLKIIRTMLDLEKLGIKSAAAREDPAGRFFFITAPSQRSRLRVDRLLLNRVLSYYQVMPEFLDFLFTFGFTERPKDFHFSGFRSEMNFGDNENRLYLPELGRSGRELRMCYLLQSPESLESPKTGAQRKWPWSIRQCVAYHSYDLETNKAVWLVVKANKKIRDRIHELCEEQDDESSDPETYIRQPFEAALLTHLVICAWACESWRWYINFLEEKVQELTEEALVSSPDTTAQRKRSALSRAQTTMSGGAAFELESLDFHRAPTFSAEHLQDVHDVDEKANAALMVLTANAAVLKEMRNCYVEANQNLRDQHGLHESATPPQLAIAMFLRRADASSKDLSMQGKKLESLLKLLANRRVLLESMLQWQNARISLDLANKSQVSAEKMQSLTSAMYAIAQTTKVETISMRIITLVTLFYLPGTFISTLMSTPIVTFQAPDTAKLERRITPDALFLFLELSLPLLCGTLAFWYLFKRQEEKKLAWEDQMATPGP